MRKSVPGNDSALHPEEPAGVRPLGGAPGGPAAAINPKWLGAPARWRWRRSSPQARQVTHGRDDKTGRHCIEKAIIHAKETLIHDHLNTCLIPCLKHCLGGLMVDAKVPETADSLGEFRQITKYLAPPVSGWVLPEQGPTALCRDFA